MTDGGDLFSALWVEAHCPQEGEANTARPARCLEAAEACARRLVRETGRAYRVRTGAGRVLMICSTDASGVIWTDETPQGAAPFLL